MDDSSKIEALRGLGTYHAREEVDDVAARFLYAPTERFIPCYSPSPDTVRVFRPTGLPTARRKRRRSLGIARTGLPTTPYRIVDISVTGALLETSNEVPVGNTVELDLQLENGATAKVQATVARIQYSRWGVVPGIGVRFTHFEDNAQRVIESYVES